MARKGKSRKGSRCQSTFAKMGANLLLVEAVEKSDLKAVKRYLESNKAGADINCLVKDDSGMSQTPLLLASRKGELMIVQYLVQRAVNLDIRNDKGESAVMLAVEQGHVEVAKFLAQQGSDLYVINDEGKTALMLAEEKGEKELAQIFANYQLVQAVKNSDLEAVKKCLESPNVKAEIDCSVKVGSLKPQTPLMFASQKGELMIVQYLVQTGAKLDMRNVEGKTALIFAAEQGKAEVAQFLAQQGADLEIIKKQGSSWYLSDKTEDEDGVEDEDGRTALMLAAENGHDKVVEVLAEHGADKVTHLKHIP